MAGEILTFGDVRKTLLEVVVALKSDQMEIGKGMAIAALLKVFNDNIHAEINAGKLSLAAAQAGQNFGDIVQLGLRTVIDGVPMIEKAQIEA